MLRLDEYACASELKTDSMCKDCKRDIPQYEVTTHTLFSEFSIVKKVVDGKFTTICKGKIV